ncbi:DEAD/DEAH box helicase family protein [Nocardia bovistercoris]|uniref:Uncharacterized protein n=1 Tax=Nocardia bovistercoris TaxID=2785916 RepID=A0A931N1T8_9NOCA|nr:hypothetical protein [Nocardia bovistercoris]MBH0778775.1 hypothetical protein [Nocardia bovistercoris]
MSKLKTRKPTGAVPWPLILVEGGEKAGKSWAAAEFTADDRLGQSYWLDLGEGAADEYAAIEGADYLVIEHDGTYRSILEQVQAVHAEAKRSNDAGEKPVVLVVDSMTNEWDQLKDWATERARESKRGRKELAADPNAEVKPAGNLWNDSNARHYRIMNLLMQFPGIVIMTARGKEVAVIGSDGNPVAGQRDWKVEGHKNLGYDSSAWVRLSRTDVPQIVGVRSVHAGIRPGVDKVRKAPNFTLSWLIFDVLKCDPATAKVRDLRPLDATPEAVAAAPEHYDDEHTPPSVADRARAQVAAQTLETRLRAELSTANSRDELTRIWKAAGDLPDPKCGELRADVERTVADIERNDAAPTESAEADAA